MAGCQVSGLLAGSWPWPGWPVSVVPMAELGWHVESLYLLIGPPLCGSERAECLPEVAPRGAPDIQGHGLSHLCIRRNPSPGVMVTSLYSTLGCVLFRLTMKMNKQPLGHSPGTGTTALVGAITLQYTLYRTFSLLCSLGSTDDQETGGSSLCLWQEMA